ncbi:MAG TPA: hypothetical protein ENK61_03395, partial [Devosia sp.]|nr:hypothetical protein [Devosia sp.]
MPAFIRRNICEPALRHIFISKSQCVKRQVKTDLHLVFAGICGLVNVGVSLAGRQETANEEQKAMFGKVIRSVLFLLIGSTGFWGMAGFAANAQVPGFFPAYYEVYNVASDDVLNIRADSDSGAP